MRMPSINCFEKDGIQQGSLPTSREDVIDVLETQFSNVPTSLKNRIFAINDLALLNQPLQRAIPLNSVQEFEDLLAQGEFYKS